ncbi:motility associated factor glycosyltransferase family protein [Clostridium butyricum]|uniref:motility associated factor glycosyltransferase family protein n=1 Tax=Clostridium butyricum TaxID=1492 RepID=UPI000408E2E7|nr:6-hydroxymethylpterin diphosphokinase MptE-like protein [Clostridium butyricum]
MLENFWREYSYDGYEIFRIKKEKKLLYLGSKYNMKIEIEKIQNNIKETPDLKLIVVFGSGSGVWINELDKITSDKKILIIEPNKYLFENMKNKKFNIYRNEVQLLCMEDIDFYNNMLSVVKSSEIKILIFGNYDFVYKKELDSFISDIKRVIVDVKIRQNTSNYFSKIWLKNYLENIPQLINSNIINNYKNIFKNKPAIIISAGPSLDKNLQFLKGHEDKFIIIAVGRSLNATQKYGIKIDFTAIIDGGEDMYNVFKDSLNTEVPLLFNELSNSKIIEKYIGEKIFFSTIEFEKSDKEILNFEPITLFQGGSVAHACIDFAKILGCSCIILMGQDLAYTDDKIHASNSTAKYENNDFNDETYICVKGVKSDLVKTTSDFNMFRERIEMMIDLYNDVKFINATEGGAHIKGTIEKDLKDVICEFSEIIDKSIIYEIDHKQYIFKENILENLEEIYGKLDDIIKLCNKAKDISKKLSNNKNYNKGIKQLDRLDKKITNNIKVNYLFETIITAINNELVNKLSKDDNSKNISEKIKFISNKSEFLYSELEKAFIYGKPLIKECINKLQEI